MGLFEKWLTINEGVEAETHNENFTCMKPVDVPSMLTLSLWPNDKRYEKEKIKAIHEEKK